MTESPRTTLTKAALLEKLKKPRYEVVEVEGFGLIGIRQRSTFMASHRAFSIYDKHGELVERKRDLQHIYRLIDQVMVDENTPMFSESDADALASAAEGELDELHLAVLRFNSEIEPDPSKKKKDSSDTSES